MADEQFGFDALYGGVDTGDPDTSDKGPFDKHFRMPHVGGSWGDPNDKHTYGPGADKLRDKARDITTNGYYSFLGFYFLLYQTAGVLDKPKTRLLFPVNPESFQVSQARSFGTYDLIAGKQGMQIGQLQLRQITFSSFFPAIYDEDFCIGHYLDYNGTSEKIHPDPMIAVNWLQDQMNSTKNVYFAGLPISQGDQEPGQQVLDEFPCHITNFNYSYQAGHPRDVFYDIELTEHRELQVTRLGGTLPASQAGHPSVSKYISQIGDSYIDIAKKLYGPSHGALASRIEAANPNADFAPGTKSKTLGTSLKKGTLLKIPPLAGSGG